jgi:hypothetical protein
MTEESSRTSEATAVPSAAFSTLRSALVRHRFALAFLAVLATMLFVAPLLKQEVFTLRDHLDYFQPLRLFTSEELRAGRLPLWNPYNASGEPWLANPQTGVFYPPAWLFLVLPFATAYMLYLLVHLVLLGWGGYLLFERRASRGAALLGAAALMFSGPVLSLLDVSNNLATFAWIPLALWCAEEGAWRRGGAVLTLAFLGGEPFFAALAALLYVVVCVLARRPRDVIAAALLAFGLSAVQLLPFLALVRVSDRAAGMDGASILRNSMTRRDWIRFAWPVETSPGQEFLLVVYVGVIVLALALLGVTTLRRRREIACWLALLGASVFIASGPAFLARMPVTLFRYPARLMPFAALAIAALAAAGWDRIRRDRRWLDLLLVLVISADLLSRTHWLLHAEPFRRHPVPYDASIGASAKLFRLGDVDASHREDWISGYLNLYDRRFDSFTPAPLVVERYLRYYREIARQPMHPDLTAAAIGFTLTRNALPPPFAPVARSGNVVVFQGRYPTPMAAHIWPDPLTMRPAKWTVDTSSARVKIDAPRDGILVLRQQAAPGWNVTVDGAPAESLLLDKVYRGVRLAKGPHEVVWTYRPRSFSMGAAMTLVTLLSLQISIIVKRSSTR